MNPGKTDCYLSTKDCALFQDSLPRIAHTHSSGWNSSALKYTFLHVETRYLPAVSICVILHRKFSNSVSKSTWRSLIQLGLPSNELQVFSYLCFVSNGMTDTIQWGIKLGCSCFKNSTLLTVRHSLRLYYQHFMMITLKEKNLSCCSFGRKKVKNYKSLLGFWALVVVSITIFSLKHKIFRFLYSL